MSQDYVTFTCHGAPVSQGSHVAWHGRVVAVNDRQLSNWRAMVRARALQAAAACGWGTNFDGPVIVSARFNLRRPKKPRWPTPAVRPDLDKLARAVGDAITKSSKHGDGLISEDSRIIEWQISKHYTDALHAEGVEVTVSKVGVK